MEKCLVILLVAVARIKTEVVDSNISINDLCSVLSNDQFSQTIYINCSHLNITNLNYIYTEPNITTSNTSRRGLVVGLDLSGNHLISLGGDLVTSLLASLTSLDLNHNQLDSRGLSETSLQPAGAERSNLTILNISHNKIGHLPPSLFAYLHHLETLDLSFNPLDQLDSDTSSAIGAVGTLQFLDLRGCGLRVLQEEMMAGLTQLRTLDLSSNHFTRIDPSIRAASALTSLIVDNNDLNILDETSFQGLEQLHNLSVSYNRNLTTVEANSFSRLVELEELRLSDNPGLYWLHPGAWAAEDSQTDTEFSLKVFSLNNNSLTYLPSTLLPTFRDWSHIEYLDLQNNPWQCDCHNEGLLSNIVPLISASSPELLEDLDCLGPAGTKIAGESMFVVSQLSLTELPCDSAHFDPWLKHFWSEDQQEVKPSSSQATVAVVTSLCLGSVVFTALLVFSLYRQQAQSRGRNQYSLSDRMVGVATQWGVGYINSDYKHDEAEMTEIRNVQLWPPPSD